MITFVNTLRSVRFFFITMSKPLHSFRFRQINGIWQDTTENAGTLADFLGARNLLIDDRTQFARIKDYQEGISYWYRVDGGLITIDVWPL